MIIFANFISAVFFVFLFLAIKKSYLDFNFIVGIFVGVMIFWLVSSLFGDFVYKKYRRSLDLRYVVIPVSFAFGLCAREISLRVGSVEMLVIIIAGFFLGLLCLFFCRRIVNDWLKTIGVPCPEAQHPTSGNNPE